MSGTAQLRLTGALTEEPEIRYTPAGRAVMTFTLAGDQDVIGRDGKARTLAFYQRITMWGGLAEHLVNELTAGDAALVLGRIQQRSYDTAEGQKRSAVDVIADTIRRLERPTEDALTFDAKNQPRLKGAINDALVVGNLTRDVELRYTPNGVAVANLGVAVNDGWWDSKKREKVERVSFLDATLWEDLAEGAGELRQGHPVMLTGRITNDSYLDKDGNRRYKTKIDANFITPLARREASDNARAASAPGRAAAPSSPRSSMNIDEEFPPEEDLPFNGAPGGSTTLPQGRNPRAATPPPL